MDPTIPAPAALLLRFIYQTETGKAAPHCYEVIFGHRQSKLSKPITQMTLAEVQKEQKTWKTKAWAKKFGSSKASSATGAAQFMEFTLRDLIKELRLSPLQKLDGNLQDRLAFHLLKRRGYEAYMEGKISRTEFGKRLAMEWASLPVLAQTQGAHIAVKRGQSYYAGDNLNKSLTSPEKVEAVLTSMKSLTDEAEVPDLPGSSSPKPGSKNPLALIGAGFAALFIAIWSWFASLPCNLLGLFCGG